MMVGAVTVLTAIVAVFLAYNANSGLPFVPVYRVSVDIPNAARLSANNEVRIGGVRVGVVESLEPVAARRGRRCSRPPAAELPPVAARLNLKLDKTVQPLPEDSIFRVRYRSAFGLKYLEVVRGAGSAVPEGHVFDGTDDGAECDLPTEGGQFAPGSRTRAATAASRARPSSTRSTTPSTRRRGRRSARTSSATAARWRGAASG